jgi:hypothetical protein
LALLRIRRVRRVRVHPPGRTPSRISARHSTDRSRERRRQGPPVALWVPDARIALLVMTGW